MDYFYYYSFIIELHISMAQEQIFLSEKFALLRILKKNVQKKYKKEIKRKYTKCRQEVPSTSPGSFCM